MTKRQIYLTQRKKRLLRGVSHGVTVYMSVALWVTQLEQTSAFYNEPYRPQYHFTPKTGWIGDPDGLIQHAGKFHLFWWGHAVSDDLVYWKELPYPMLGGDDSFQYFSGSVVFDQNNTSSLGSETRPPWVAIYTAHQRDDNSDNQRISVSLDGEFYNYYKKNPILSIPNLPARDPDVFWHEETKQWVMLLVAPEKHRILFYGSPDLTTWSYLSAFGPVGARSGNWEVPNLLLLRHREDESLPRQWILVCSMGPNTIQYFPGSFDGKLFRLDPKTQNFLLNGEGIPGEVLEDFETKESLDSWKVEGSAFDRAISNKTEQIAGSLGKGFLRSNRHGTDKVGRLVSPPFTVKLSNINFLLAGAGSSEDVQVNLLIDGKRVRTVSPSDPNTMRWFGWDVSEFVGSEARFEVSDESSTGGFVAVDHIMLSNVLMNSQRENANWVDWGSDFYAARAWRPSGTQTFTENWIGWMGNWQYANQVPTKWGKGAESIPRRLSYDNSERGPQLRQHPLAALQKLRKTPLKFDAIKISQLFEVVNTLESGNSYELEADFDVNETQGQFGFNLFVGKSQQLIIGYDAAKRNVYLDRRNSGDTTFNQHFPTTTYAPLFHAGNKLKFHIFVDRSSVEVFVNDGEAVLTSLVFPNAQSRGIQLFAKGCTVDLNNLTIWPLNSIWNRENTQKSSAD